MLRVGDIIVFQPAAFERVAHPINKDTYTPVSLRGVVIAINEAHRHYTVEAEVHGFRIRECFRY